MGEMITLKIRLDAEVARKLANIMLELDGLINGSKKDHKKLIGWLRTNKINYYHMYLDIQQARHEALVKNETGTP
jgi:hypothetical protein